MECYAKTLPTSRRPRRPRRPQSSTTAIASDPTRSRAGDETLQDCALLFFNQLVDNNAPDF